MTHRRHEDACPFPALQVVLPKYTQAQTLSIIATFLKENGFTSTASVLTLEIRYLNRAVTNSAHLSKEELDQHVALCISRLGNGPAASVEPADRSPADDAQPDPGSHEPGGESVLDLINEDLDADDGLGPCSGDAANRHADDVDQEGLTRVWPRSTSKSPGHDTDSEGRQAHGRDDWRAKSSPGRDKARPHRDHAPSTLTDSRPEEHASPDQREHDGAEDTDCEKHDQASKREDGNGRKQQPASPRGELEEEDRGQRRWRRSRSSSPLSAGYRSPSSGRGHSHDSDRRCSSPNPTTNPEQGPPGSTAETAEGIVPVCASKNKGGAPKYLLSTLNEQAPGPTGERAWPRPESDRHGSRPYGKQGDGSRDYPAARGAGGVEARLYHERDKMRYESGTRASPAPSQVERSNRDARPPPTAPSSYNRDRDREPGVYRSGDRGRDSPRDYPRASTTTSAPSPSVDRYDKARHSERLPEKSRDGYDAYRRDRRPEPRAAAGALEGRNGYRGSEEGRGSQRPVEEGRSLRRPSEEGRGSQRPSDEGRGLHRGSEEGRGSHRAADEGRGLHRSSGPPPPLPGPRYSQSRDSRDSTGHKRYRDDDYR